MLRAPALAIVLLALPVVAQDPPAGVFRAWLDSPGGELPFGFELESRAAGVHATLVNGEERIPLTAHLEDGEVVVPIPHYAAELRATPSADGGTWRGAWTKRALGSDATSGLPFHAVRGAGQPRFTPLTADAPPADLTGRWRVAFESAEDPAVALFEQGEGDLVTGTFLTTTGDYRYLAGSLEGDRLRLSCFDGAHAFLFDARLREDGSLAGDFWSRDSWHETWTAVRDDDAELPDAFAETRWTGGSANALCFPDLDGAPRLVGDPAFAGRARLLVVFGSWCPNCHDEARFLAELDRLYGDRGLSILGLAFELTGDFERDAAQVRAFQARHGVDYPVLLAGTGRKPEATEALGCLSFVKSFPTTVFLDATGEVVKVHSGYVGPATGDAHVALRAEFVETIEALIARPTPAFDVQAANATWDELTGDTWFGPQLGAVGFELREGGLRVARREVDGEQTLTRVRIAGDAVTIGDTTWILERGQGRLYDPVDLDRVLTGLSTMGLEPEGDGPAARRSRLLQSATTAELGAYLVDEDPLVRATAVWAAGLHGGEEHRATLLEQSAHPNPLLRREATRALRRLFPDDEELAAALAPRATDPHPLVRAAATRDVTPLTWR